MRKNDGNPISQFVSYLQLIFWMVWPKCLRWRAISPLRPINERFTIIRRESRHHPRLSTQTHWEIVRNPFLQNFRALMVFSCVDLFLNRGSFASKCLICGPMLRRQNKRGKTKYSNKQTLISSKQLLTIFTRKTLFHLKNTRHFRETWAPLCA